MSNSIFGSLLNMLDKRAVGDLPTACNPKKVTKYFMPRVFRGRRRVRQVRLAASS